MPTLEAFVKYFSSIWGILAGISTILPFIGSMSKVIHTPPDREKQSNVIATTGSAFALYFSFMLSPYLITYEYYAIIASGILAVIAIRLLVKCSEMYSFREMDKLTYGMIDEWVNAYVWAFIIFSLSFSVLAALDFWRHQI